MLIILRSLELGRATWQRIHHPRGSSIPCRIRRVPRATPRGFEPLHAPMDFDFIPLATQAQCLGDCYALKRRTRV